MSIYADSSFIISLYVTDAHSSQADGRLAGNRRIWLTPLHKAEFVHAIEQNVFRRAIAPAAARALYVDFQSDLESGFWLEVDLPFDTFERSIQVARAHVARLGARTLDTLHVAAALSLGARDFWTFDDRQAKLAKAVGLKAA